MNRQTSTLEFLSFAFLLSASLIYTQELQKSTKEDSKESIKPVEEFYEETSSEDQFSLESSTTTESATTIETYRKLTLSVTGKNNSREFRPSVHLGEIKESRISAGPFNDLHHFKFDSGVDPNSYRGHLKDFKVVFQPTQPTIPGNYEGNAQQNLFETATGSVDEAKKNGIEQNNYVKFQDDSLDLLKMQYGGSLKDQGFHQQFINPTAENMGTRYELMDQQLFQNLEKPVFEQQASTYLGKPSKFQGETPKHEVVGFTSADYSKAPYYAGFYDHQNHQAAFQDLDLFKKPVDGVVYVQESSFLRTRKFPYAVYQPQLGYQQVEFVKDDHPSYPARRRIPAWKKILHLIGAFLPLGLLLAALTPNVVKVDNATQPNIVLSKWRVADLPVEHKQARFTDPSSSCEERSICDMILAGGDPGSTALQNILWNLATRNLRISLSIGRTSTAMAKESGLQEIFEAVKKKDCDNVSC